MERGNQNILQSGAHEEKGEIARLQYFVGAIAIGDLIKTTLGPRGMDKIIQPMPGDGAQLEKATITNDGATILRSVYIDNPSSKILVDVSKQQDIHCGDGTTGVVVLAAEIIRNAENLVNQKIHPQVICDGIRMAVVAAQKALLERVTKKFDRDGEEFKSKLLDLAKTTLSSKLLNHEKELFAKLAVDAVLRLRGGSNLDYIQIIKKQGGTMADSFLADGFLLEKKIGVGQPKRLENCKVLVANTPMDSDKIKIYGAKVQVDSFVTLQEIEAAERDKMKSKVDKILKHGCNVFVNRQLIYNYPDQLFKNAGVIAIEHSDFDGTERLAAVLGSEIVSTFENPEKVTLGTCDLIEECTIGEDGFIKFSGCKKNEACSIVLRGANKHVLEEAERSIHDAIAVISQTVLDSQIVYGAGAAEMAMADALEKLSREVEGKKALAIEAFAQALRAIPTIILDNGGFDSADVVTKLRAAHARGEFYMGIDIDEGAIGDVRKLGIMESYKSKSSQVAAAAEAAQSVIRVDDIIRCAPRQRSPEL
eukprot:GHVP01066584.1.p2 GENE.GHVP01066584.1~~GHVP01066584.1.p2  ORF type:complete len:535 (-),score=104.85 GHVP01066584.1:3086-4690(-)